MSKYHCAALNLKSILKTFNGGELEAVFRAPGGDLLEATEIRKRLNEYIKTGVLFIPLIEGQCPNFSKKVGCPGHRKPQPTPRKMKLAFIDVETTGTKYWRNGIHQLSGCLEIGGQVVAEFNYKVKPNPAAEIEDEALAVAGITRADLETYRPMGEVYKEFTALLSKHVSRYDKKDKFFFIGFNSQAFDVPMVRAWFVQNGDNYFGSYFWSDSPDVMCLASQQLMGVRHTMEDFKLKTVARKLGVIVDESRLHDALYDIEITRQAFHILTKLKAVKVETPETETEAKQPADLPT